MTRRVAFVTGASRGIGKACAVHLARAGFDVAVTARTVRDGEEREHSSTVRRSDTRPLPGSLTATAEGVRAAGQEALVLPADLLDRASLGAAVATVQERWGGVDVLVNNGRYIGPGHMDQFLDTPIGLLDQHLEANVMAPLVLLRACLPGMVARGAGLVANITSSVAWMDPPAPAGEGGWGLGYAMSKGALHRVAGLVQLELAGTGVALVNIDPGFIATERMAQDMAEFGFDASAGAPPDVIGAVVAWLARDGHATEWAGGVVPGQRLCHEQGLLPGWAGPVPNPV
ncbi:MAG TPA: SDR family oxidoreductase [Acidimicrobiia bacterium]|jgi:NAD(P)-dependent dehydrogenase (short-subunit alcohol dehydrogenase family)